MYEENSKLWPDPDPMTDEMTKRKYIGKNQGDSLTEKLTKFVHTGCDG